MPVFSIYIHFHHPEESKKNCGTDSGVESIQK